MRSLFLKIFLWFWLAMATVVVVFAVLVASTQDDPRRDGVRRDDRNERNDRDRGRDWRDWRGRSDFFRQESGRDALALYLETAAHLIENGGPNAMQPYRERLNATGRVRTFLFDERGSEISPSPPSPKLHETLRNMKSSDLSPLVERTLQSGKIEIENERGFLGAAQVITTKATAANSPRRYVVAGALRGWRFGGFGFSPNNTPNSASAAPNSAPNASSNAAPSGAPPNGSPQNSGRGPDRGRPRGPLGFMVWLLIAEPEPQIQALRLLVVLVTTGLVCYGLVRHLTSPILQLRVATHRVAEGDLSTRVGGTIGRRRDELGVLARDFDRMTARLESLMHAQNRLIADISHELRSPLARVNVALGLVRQTAGPDATEDLDRIELETDRLNAMIGELLTLSRLESGEQRAETTPVDLALLVDEIASDADFEARSRNRAVRVAVSEPCVVSGTEPLLRSAIENVVRNAVRYTDENTTVEITLEAREQIVIRVRDHGPGVPEDALSQLFRPFYRIADARDRQSGGTGLGLAITDRSVSLHGGTVAAYNAEDGGLLVEMRLPSRAKTA